MSPTSFIDGIHNTVANAGAAISKAGECFARDPSGKFTSQNRIAVVVVALVCAVLPLDISELICGVIGAFAFACFQSHHRESKRRLQPKSVKPAPFAVQTPSVPPPWRKSTSVASHGGCRQQRAVQGRAMQKSNQPTEEQNVNKFIGAPILAPTFCSTDWDGEVSELLTQIMPTVENEETVNQLARIIKRHIRSLMPEAEVAGYVSGNFTSGKAFGVAVPDVDIVASVSPAALVSRMQCGSAAELRDERKIQKWAIRGCTDRLVATGGFKFRRSAFKCDEPKVTLIAAPSLGLCAESIPMDFSVNVVTPLYNAALLTECGQMEPRAKELILLVKRWAKDRGICHAPKGHLSPYLWGILAIYFLQVECQLLPSLQHFKLSSSLMGAGKVAEPKLQSALQASAGDKAQHSTAGLFKEFINFYTSKFDWRNEAISVCQGCRAAPSRQLPIHIIVQEGADGSTTVGPSIEDPFKANQNLGACMTAESMSRLKEELKRADDFCHRGESLTMLLEPWAPAESEAGSQS